MQIRTGEMINLWVRDFFASGHKSNNKLYDPDGPSVELRSMGWQREYQQKAAKRQQQAELSSEHRISSISDQCLGGHRYRPTSFFHLAELVKKMPAADRSGNCMEMAVLSDYEAITFYGTRRSLCYLCVITAPGDHAFALISESPIMGEHWQRGMAFASVSDFAKASAAKSWLVIDPWLNTVCTAGNYLERGGRKLDDWTAKGKQIRWAHGSNGPTAYPPGGSNSEYKQKFGIAPLAIIPF